MLEFCSQGSSSPQKLLHFEVLNIQMYPDTSMAGIGWTRNALATPSSRFTTSPSADSCRFMRTIALHTWDKPRILFHKYEKITNSVDHMDTTAHTAHFYKPHMNSIDNVQHCYVCGMRMRMLSLDAKIFVYFLGARLFLQSHAAKILPSSLPTSPVRAHWIIFIFYITHQLIIFYYWASPVRVQKSEINWLPNLTLWLAVKRETADTVKNMRAEH